MNLHPFQDGGHHLHVLRARGIDFDLAACNRRDDGPAAGLHVIAPQLVLRSVQLPSAVHTNRGRAASGDPDAKLLEEMTQLGDVRLACRMTDFRTACGTRRGQKRRLGAGHRRFVEIHRRRPEAVWRFEHVAGTRDDPRTHRLERLDMRRERPARGKITAGRGELRAAAACQQRTEQQDRSAQPADQRAIGLVFHQLGTPDAQRRAADAFDLRAQIEEQPRHHFDIADPRHVRQHAFVRRQQARGEQRQRGILVAFDRDGTRQAMAAFNQ